MSCLVFLPRLTAGDWFVAGIVSAPLSKSAVCPLRAHAPRCRHQAINSKQSCFRLSQFWIQNPESVLWRCYINSGFFGGVP